MLELEEACCFFSSVIILRAQTGTKIVEDDLFLFCFFVKVLSLWGIYLFNILNPS